MTAFAGASTGMLDDDDAALAAAEIEPGSAAVLIVYENRWAAPFIAAVRRNGGELIANERIGVRTLSTLSTPPRNCGLGEREPRCQDYFEESPVRPLRPGR